MKAEIEGTQGRILTLKLSPENDADKRVLEAFGADMRETHHITARGFKYLSPDVEFVINPVPRVTSD